LLASCYRESLRLAAEKGLRSIAFPSISTGVYGFPIERACRIALREIRDFLAPSGPLQRVLLVCFSARDLDIYQTAYSEIFGNQRNEGEA